MQSSAVVTLRALVMLLCLVLVPLAAIFGSSLPQVFESIVQGHGIPRFTKDDNSAENARKRGGDAPVFGAPADAAPRADAPHSPPGLDGTASLWAPAAVPAGLSEPRQPPAAQAQTAHFNQPSASPGVRAQLPQAGPARPQQGCEQFQQIEHRLRDLGATYYLLETWGNAGQMYRFHCKVSTAPHAQQTRHFDATDADPLQAMRLVLHQVEQFRAGNAP